MRLKSVGWSGCLVAALTGCASLPNSPGRSPVSDSSRSSPAELSQSRDAHIAWQAFRNQDRQCSYSDAFQRGFLDGYVSYFSGGRLAPLPETAKRPGKKLIDGVGARNDATMGFRYGREMAAVRERQRRTGDTGWVLAPAGTEPGSGDGKAARSSPVAKSNPDSPALTPSSIGPVMKPGSVQPSSPILVSIPDSAQEPTKPIAELLPETRFTLPRILESPPPPGGANLPSSLHDALSQPGVTTIPLILGDIPALPFRLAPRAPEPDPSRNSEPKP
jgi:hypothetical protein